MPLIALSEAQRTQTLERFAIIRLALEDGITQAQVARAHQIPPSTVQLWIKCYREKGLVRRDPSPTTTSFPIGVSRTRACRSAATTQKEIRMTQSFACPLCRKDDMVRKVSAIVTEEMTLSSHEGYASGSGPIYTSVFYQTALGKLLDFPEQSYRGLEILQICGFGLFVGCLPLAVLGGLEILQSCGFGPFVDCLPLAVLDGLIVQFTSLVIFFASLALLGGMVAGIVTFIKHWKMESDRPQQEEAFARWDALYYCRRNDIVFLPGSQTKYAPPKKIDTLIFTP